MTDNRERIGIYLPHELKGKLEEIKDESGFSLNQLGLMAFYDLVARYNESGLSIFEDLQRIKNEVQEYLR